MWSLLRGRQFLGLKFRRQAPIETFIADFLCERLRLVIEVDGEVHNTEAQVNRDANREGFLESRGYTVLRFTNQQVLEEPQAVIRQLEAFIHR